MSNKLWAGVCAAGIVLGFVAQGQVARLDPSRMYRVTHTSCKCPECKGDGYKDHCPKCGPCPKCNGKKVIDTEGTEPCPCRECTGPGTCHCGCKAK